MPHILDPGPAPTPTPHLSIPEALAEVLVLHLPECIFCLGNRAGMSFARIAAHATAAFPEAPPVLPGDVATIVKSHAADIAIAARRLHHRTWGLPDEEEIS